MMVAGLVVVAGALFPRPVSEFVIAATIAVMALTSVAYSYFAWRQETRNGGRAADTGG
jgi:hypothetical protein